LIPSSTSHSVPFFRNKEMSCPSDNTQVVDQSQFWSQGSLHWDAHRVGMGDRRRVFPCGCVPSPRHTTWVHVPCPIADSYYFFCNSFFSTVGTLRHFIRRLVNSRTVVTIPRRAEQRQMYVHVTPPFCGRQMRLWRKRIRILYMPPVICCRFLFLLPVFSEVIPTTLLPRRVSSG